MPTETGFGGTAQKRSRRSAHTVVYGAQSSSVLFRITHGNVLPALEVPTDTSGDITINYSLKNPREIDASIVMQYSDDNRSTWSTCTSAGGDDGDDDLSTSAVGEDHVFEWDTTTDIGIDFKGTIYVRVKAYDITGQKGDFEYSEEHKINIDNSPGAATITIPTDGYFDKDQTFPFQIEIPDPVAGNSDVHVKLEIDPSPGFNSNSGDPLKVFESRLDQVGWEYDSDGAGAYADIPFDGIPIEATPALIGNTARYTITTEERLTPGEYYVRVTFGGVTS